MLLSGPSGSPPPASPTCPATSHPIPQATSVPGPKETSAVTSVTPAVTAHVDPRLSNSNSSTINTQACRTRKAQVLDLNACVCGVTITDGEIQQGENIMKCRAPGCKTVWVRTSLFIIMLCNL